MNGEPGVADLRAIITEARRPPEGDMRGSGKGGVRARMGGEPGVADLRAIITEARRPLPPGRSNFCPGASSTPARGCSGGEPRIDGEPIGVHGTKGGGGKGRSGSMGGRGAPVLWSQNGGTETFSAAVTFAGRVDEFVIAGDTFVHASRYQHLREKIGAGVVLRGIRQPNSHGKSKWNAISVTGAEAPDPSVALGEAFSEILTYAGRCACIES